MKKWVEHVAQNTDDPGAEELMPALISTGVFDSEEELRFTFSDALGSGSIDLIRHLAPKLDWAAMDEDVNPAVLVMADFERWSSRTGHMLRAGSLVYDLLEEHGRADLIAMTDSQLRDPQNRSKLPLVCCVEHSGAKGLMIRCLEHGANPLHLDGEGTSAMRRAEEDGDEDIINIFRSALARREAAAAVAELDAEFASSGNAKP